MVTSSHMLRCFSLYRDSLIVAGLGCVGTEDAVACAMGSSGVTATEDGLYLWPLPFPAIPGQWSEGTAGR